MLSCPTQTGIYEPHWHFFTTKEFGKGTGLGLAISYQIIIEKHNGKIQYSPKLGQGT
jgi:two-component system, NtrC family, sensor kinase